MHVCTYTHLYIHIYFTACGPPKHQLICNTLVVKYRKYRTIIAQFGGGGRNIQELHPQCTANWRTWRMSDFVRKSLWASG